MITAEELSQLILDHMVHQPTYQQRALIEALARFCVKPDQFAPPVFLLNGYAGTGKTSVIGALVKALERLRINVVLLSPTGRAAKVLSSHAAHKAFTIHRVIYHVDPSGIAYRSLASNPMRDAIFIVDEASMIGDNESENLLEDLINYVYGMGDNCRMILLGDSAQLPPVGCLNSPAMSVDKLKAHGLKVSRAVMTQTVRQPSASGILYNATRLRTDMASAQAAGAPSLPVPHLSISDFDNVRITGQEDLADDIASAFSRHGIDGTILITRSNKRALLYNLAIRNTILEKESVLHAGEPLIVGKNNYHWLAKISRGDFLANGEIITVESIYGYEEVGQLKFADVSIRLSDRDMAIDCKLLIDSLTSETASISMEQEAALVEVALRDVDSATLSDPARRARILRSSPYYNALRVKYAYAVTCHKAQGGQWSSVFVDMAGIAPEATTTIDFYRWLYTAVTRAVESVTFIAPTIEVS